MSQTLEASVAPPPARRPTNGSPSGRCWPGCSPGPRSARWSAPSSSHRLLHRRAAVPRRRLAGDVLYVSSTVRHPRGRGGAADDRRRVRPVRRRRGHHLGAGRLDVAYQFTANMWVGVAGLAGRGAGHRRSQRLPGGEDRHPELPRHARHVLHAARPQPGRHQAGHRQRRHQRRVRHRRLRLGEDGLRLLVHDRRTSTIRITLLWWILFVAPGDLGAAAHPHRQLDLRGRRRRRPAPGRSASRSTG